MGGNRCHITTRSQFSCGEHTSLHIIKVLRSTESMPLKRKQTRSRIANASLEVLHEYGTEPELEQRGNHAAGSKPTPTPLHTALPLSVDFVPLSPLMEQVSSRIRHRHTIPTRTTTGSGSSHGVGTARSPRPSSILDPNPQPSQPIQRSNSWWAHFAKSPLLERRGLTGVPGRLKLEF